MNGRDIFLLSLPFGEEMVMIERGQLLYKSEN